MKASVFLEKDTNVRNEVLKYRLALIEQMSSMTQDTTILSGLARLRDQISMKWVEPKESADKRNRLQKKRLNHITQSTATNNGKRWSNYEVTQLMNLEIIDRDLAVLLGRTAYSVRSKRKWLTKQGL